MLLGKLRHLKAMKLSYGAKYLIKGRISLAYRDIFTAFLRNNGRNSFY